MGQIVSYLGCKFEVIAELDDDTIVIRNCATKLRQEPRRVEKRSVSAWRDMPKYPVKDKFTADTVFKEGGDA